MTLTTENMSRPVDEEPTSPDVGMTEAVAAADPGLLLMSLVQMTGDRTLLKRYADAFHPLPVRNAFGVHEIDETAAHEIRQLTARALARGRASWEAVPMPVPDPALFREMAELCTGGPVDTEFVPLLMQQSGFVADDRVITPTKTPAGDFHVAVIGSGMVGLNAGVKLALSGFGYTIFESRDDLGGTWSINTYPGAAVDTPSHYYSYSFELNPNWPHYYPGGATYQRYLEHVADKYGVRDRIRFGTKVLGCRWDDDEQVWVVRATRGGVVTEHRASAVITAVGVLNSPNKPEFPERERFGGTVMHTAEWDHSVDLEGKRVVIVGTGCTSVQVVTSIAPKIEHLTVVQRQPHWVAPDPRVIDSVPDTLRWSLANIPYYQNWMRLRAYWFVSDNNIPVTRIDPEWAKDHLSVSPANDVLLQKCLEYLDTHFADDPEMKAKLTPDFPPYAKRIVKDPGFYETLKRSNVELQTGTIERYTEDGVALTGGLEVPCDVVILATGFQLENLGMLDIVGREGRTLAETWGLDPKAYHGITVPGFPNLFTTVGPNSGANHGAGHNLVGEEHVHYAVECLQLLVERDLAALEPKPEVTEEYHRKVDAEMDKTVWQHAGTAHGYYRNAAGRARIQNPWRMVDYWHMMRQPNVDDYLLHERRGS